MPIYSIQGPDGKIYEIEGPAGATKAQVVAAIQAKMQASAPAPAPVPMPVVEPAKKEGFGAALGKGIEGILSPSRTAIGALTGSAEEAALAGLKRSEESPYADQVSLDKVKAAYQRGLIPAAGEVLRQIPLAITEQAPNIAATLGSAKAGSLLGAKLGTAVAPGVGTAVGTIGGGILGAVAPSLVQQFGGNIQRQAQEQLAAKQPVDISRTAAIAAAVPQAGLDVAATLIPLGRTVAGSVLGPQVKQLLEAGAKEGAEKLARESLPTVLAKGAGISIASEAPTEVVQSMLERAQAGLPLLSDDALKEYGESAYQAALIAPIGSAARVGERSAARQQPLAEGMLPGETERQAAERLQAEILSMKQAAQPPAPGPILSTNNLYNLMAQPNGYGLVEQYKQRLMAMPNQTPEVEKAIEEAAFIQNRADIEKAQRRTTKPAPEELIQPKGQDAGEAVTPPSGESVQVAGEPDTGAATQGPEVTQPSGVVSPVADVGQPSTGEGSKPAAVTPEVVSVPTTTRDAVEQHAVKGLPIIEAPLDQLTISKDVPQFKSEADERGVVKRLEGKFERTGVAPIQLWRRKDGRLEVISGRHRFDLAQRSGETTIPAQIHDETTGFDAAKAGTLDAELNIRDEQGEVKDYVVYFERSGISEADAKARGLLGRTVGQRGWAIASQGSPDLIAAHRAGIVPDDAAAGIATIAPKDSRLQAVGLKAVRDNKSTPAVLNTMQAVKALAAEKGAPQEEAGDLFGFDDSAIKEAEEMARIATDKQREVSKRLDAISGAAKRPDVAKAEGIDIKDEAALNKRIQELRQLRASWSNWSSSPNLIKEIRDEMTKPVEPKKSLVEMRKRYEAARAAPAEAPVETKPEPTELDKEIEAKIEELGRVLSRIMGRFGLKDVALNLVEDMKAEGEYAQSVIRLALDAASPVQALRHESIHALKELGFFTPQQWSVLERQAKSKWIDQYLKNVNINKEPLGEGEKSRYDAYSDLFKSQGLSDAAIEEAIREEAIADAFGDFDVNKAPAGLMQALLNRLRQFFDAVRTAFGGEITAEQVFRKVEKGELKAEAAPSTKEEAKPSLRAPEKRGTWYVDATPQQQETLDRWEDDRTSGTPSNWQDLDIRPAREDIYDSASGFFYDYEKAKGLFEIPIADIGPLTGYDNAKDKARIQNLAEQIKENREIEPVFVAVDPNGEAYLMEGQHRSRALELLGYKSVPARVIVSMDHEDQPAAKPSLRAPQTEAFKKWFGNSKVVDKNGDPLVVYHYTASSEDFSKFATKENVELGSHFGTKEQILDLDDKELYQAKPRVLPVYLSIQNPIRLRDDGGFQPARVLRQLDDMGLLTERQYNALASESNEQKANAKIRDFLIKAGYDGVVYINRREGYGRSASAWGDAQLFGSRWSDEQWLEKHPEGRDSYIAFKPTQIKSATGNIGTFDARKPDIRYSLRDSIGLYSELENKVAQGPNKAPAASWKAYINGLTQKGVKPEEIEWSGVRDWLDLQTGPVSKDAVNAYLKQGGVKVEEVVLGGKANWTQEDSERLDDLEDRRDDLTPEEEQERTNLIRRENDATEEGFSRPQRLTKYGQYTLPGGENYREVLLTLPGKQDEAARNKRLSEIADEMSDSGTTPERYRELYEERSRLASEYTASDEAKYKSSHWDQPNVIAHIRLNDRIDADGNKVLFVEEIQSDWGQEGKKKGFRDDAANQKMFANESRIEDLDAQIRDINFQMRGLPDSQMDEFNALADKRQKLYDEQQRLGEEINLLRDKAAGEILPAPFVSKTEGWLNLALKRIMVMAAEGGYDKVAFITGGQSHKRFPKKASGESTKESFKAFYDQIVPLAVKKLLPKAGGGQMGDVNLLKDSMKKYDKELMKDDLRILGEEGFRAKYAHDQQPGFSVTPEMKQKVETTGLPRFSLRASVPRDILNRVVQTTVAREEQGFAQRITEAISPQSFSSFRAAALNRYNQLGVYDKKLAEKMGGKVLLANTSAEAAALLSDLGAGLTASALGVHDRMGGIPVYRNGITTISNLNNTIKGPVAIFAPLAKYGDPFAYQAYQYWAGVKRGLRFLYTIDPKTGKAVERLFTEDDGPKAERLRQQFLKDGIDFEAIQKEWIKYNNGLVDYMVDTGVLAKERADIYKQYADYLPFYRQMEGEATVGPKIFQAISGVKPPKKLKGGEAPLDDFLENIVRNTQAAIQAGVKNVAAQRAADVAVKIQMADRLDYQSSAPNTFQVLEKGKVVTYSSQDMLFINAIKSLGLPDLPFIGFLSGPANLLRNLVTKDPGFMLANLMRDSMSAWVTSGVKMTPIVDTISNFGSAIAGKNPAFQALMNAGILGGYEFSQNVEQSGREFAAALRKQAGVRAPGYKGLLELGAKPFTSLWEALEKGSTASDAATRMEVYKKTLAETGNEAEALYRALEVMNFNRKGSSAVIRVLTAAVPFLNARMQGLDVLYRAATGKIVGPKAAEIQKQFFVRGATIAAISAAYWLLTHDDEEYKKQEQETRDNYWLLPSLGIKIPIPFEIGVLFKVIPERILAYTFGSDTGEDFIKSMARQLTSTLAFNPIPQTVLPVVESMTNFSFFTMRPIVGQGLEGIQPAYQVGPGTSRLAEMVGDATKGMAKELQISPMKLDQLISGYTGTMGMYLVNLMDAVYDMNTDSPKPSMRFERLPVIRRFALDPEARGAVTGYYELKNSVDSIVRTSNMLERTMNYEELPAYLQDNMRMLAAKDYLLDLEKTMKEYREMKIMIRSSKMEADAKRDAILAIDQMENQLTANIQYLKSLAKGG